MTTKPITPCLIVSFLSLYICQFCLEGNTLYAQQEGITYGIETDVLPFALSGYIGAAWIGKGHFRMRALHASVKMPSITVPDEFTNNRIRSTAILLDYFPAEGFRGWWAGGGYVFWDGSIQTADRSARSDYKTHLLNGSLGYQFPFGDHFYLSPWGGLSIRVAGEKEIPVGEESFEPSLLNPELSLKLGWEF